MVRLMQEASARQASAVDLNAMTEEEERRYLADLVIAEGRRGHRRVDLVRAVSRAGRRRGGRHGRAERRVRGGRGGTHGWSLYPKF